MKIKSTCISVLLLIIHTYMYGQWHGDPAIVDNPISTSPANESDPHCIPDGVGGAIYVWNGTGQFLAQRKTASGAPMWSTVSQPVQVLLGSGTIFDITADGKGGAYFSLQKYYTSSSADVYIQYINKDGKLPFGINGIKVNPTGSHYNTDPKICADSNGVIITWSDNISQQGQYGSYISYAQVFAQRYDSTGNPKWGSLPLLVSTANGIRNVPEIVSDGKDGAFIAFTDYRNASLNANDYYDNLDVYAQHLDSNGSRLLGALDLVITSDTYSQSVYNNDYPSPAKSMISDSAGGCILIFRDIDRDGLYAQRITSNGICLFGAGGLVISPGGGYHSFLHLESDGANGVVAGWSLYDFASGFVYAQRVTGNGLLPWGNNGVLVNPLANEDFSRVSITMASDHAGNYIFGWPVQDAGDLFNYKGFKGQKINNAGVPQWLVSGVDIFTNPDASVYYPCMVYNSNQSIVTVWSDKRNFSTNGSDIYGAKIGPDGVLIESAATEYFTAADGNWNNPATWTANTVPLAATDVIIHHNILVDINTSCNSLKVEVPGSLTVNTGINITVLH
ncbi:MAG: hypothetical protein ABJA90_01635 [Ginsengibacter sp.]